MTNKTPKVLTWQDFWGCFFDNVRLDLSPLSIYQHGDIMEYTPKNQLTNRMN